MNISRREFMKILAVSLAAGTTLGATRDGKSASYAPIAKNYYDIKPFGNVSLLHITDVHAQLTPIYYREPGLNLGTVDNYNRPPHLIGNDFLQHFNLQPNTPEAYAFTSLDFTQAAHYYGKLGGFAHLATLIKHIRGNRPNALLLDGGDNWQGSATSLWTNAQDMIDATKLLGVDVMTGHWEFTFGAKRVKHVIKNDFKDKLDFVAQNVTDKSFGDPIFNPYSLREVNGYKVAVIGQAFPYTPIANPRFFIPDWSFGLHEDNLQRLVNEVRGKGASVVVVVSHNGMDVDIKTAQRVRGIDFIMGGHTHDAIPKPMAVKNAGGTTYVINSGSSGKFLSVLDLQVKKSRVTGFRYKLLPVFSRFLRPDPAMQTYINNVRKPFKARLEEKLATTQDLLYRRGTFNGSFDQLILDALMKTLDAEIAFSPGFRWGMSVLPGQPITFEDIMTQTAITYPMVTLTETKGSVIKSILEDVADNLFNPDPYKQQGGDMVRVGGLQYAITPHAASGQRISDMTLNGKPIVANKKYKVAGWANVTRQLDGTPVWDVVANYLRSQKTVSIKQLNVPQIK